MDNEKIGRLIRQLRQEKGMTQREVAERLNLSNKTVSKWECGLGCPDVGLWEGLSALLGADLLKLLQGELRPNRPDVGKLSRARFYVCPGCGNILVSSGDASVACCGRKLRPLAAAPADPAHEPAVSDSDDEFYVIFPHEMTKAHSIAFAALLQDSRVTLIRLYPEQEAAFRLPASARGGTLYAYCTLHGLMRCAGRIQ